MRVDPSIATVGTTTELTRQKKWDETDEDVVREEIAGSAIHDSG